MRTLLERRAVLVNGKGGVGKTTVAAALAHLSASLGRRTLVAEVSYDPEAPSPLGRALGVPKLREEPTRIAANLEALLLTPTSGHVRFLRHAIPGGKLAEVALKAAAIRRFLLAAPTLAEMGVLYRLLDLVKQPARHGGFEHEVIIVDLPATGHALGLAQVPTAILEVIHSGPIAAAVREGLELLHDATKTTSVVVTLPETLPVSEAAELIAGLQKHRIPFSGVVLNRMPSDPFTPSERAAIDPLVLGKPLLGARSLPRIDRAKAAVQRLRELGLQVSQLEELPERGPIAAALAEKLGALR